MVKEHFFFSDDFSFFFNCNHHPACTIPRCWFCSSRFLSLCFCCRKALSCCIASIVCWRFEEKNRKHYSYRSVLFPRASSRPSLLGQLVLPFVPSPVLLGLTAPINGRRSLRRPSPRNNHPINTVSSHSFPDSTPIASIHMMNELLLTHQALVV